MNSTSNIFFAIALVMLATVCASAQTRALGARSLVLDDGAGNTTMLVAASGGTGTFTLPALSLTFPSTNASGVLTNNGSGSLSWAASSGFTPAYFNAYTTSVAATIPAGGEVPVTTVGASSGFTSDGSGGFTVSATGVYNVEYTVARDESSAFAITVNGTKAAGSEFGCATGTSIVHGNVILSLTASDVIKLIASPNNSSAVTMETLSAGNTVEASLTAIRIQ
ncbi:MAG TPA: hypothetical protein VFH95_12710 [Candidatus Kapabacteria bacterium]|nr:hypothetical protein [Candidatus Kapabacteria bacterium]